MLQRPPSRKQNKAEQQTTRVELLRCLPSPTTTEHSRHRVMMTSRPCLSWAWQCLSSSCVASSAVDHNPPLCDAAPAQRSPHTPCLSHSFSQFPPTLPTQPHHHIQTQNMRCSRTSFLAAATAAAALLLALPAASAVETLPELRHEKNTPSWPGSVAPVTELDVGAYTGRWFQVRTWLWLL